jgi:hypothetical protein
MVIKDTRNADFTRINLQKKRVGEAKNPILWGGYSQTSQRITEIKPFFEKENDITKTETYLQSFKQQTITNLIRDLSQESIRLQISRHNPTYSEKKSQAQLSI